MEGELLVSIVINNYNYARFLSFAIDSALKQTYPNVEVIVVDDCSTDDSRQVIESYGDRIISVLHETNGKQGAAFNSGFAKSQGDIILFLDSDDYLYPDAVRQIVATWQPEISKVHYRLDVVDIAGQPRGFSYPQGSNKLAKGEVWQTLLNIGTYIGVPTSGNALSRRTLAQITPIPSEYNTTSDDYLSVLMPLYGEVLAIEEPLGAYRLHDSNQWALTMLTSDRFRRFVNHDLKRCQLLKEKAPQLGYSVPDDLDFRFFGRVWSRLISLRLDPTQHLVPSDRPLPLIYWGIRAIWKYSDYNWQKRFVFSLWLIWVGLMPLPLAQPAITWLYAPQSRPNPIRWTMAKLRALAS
jgi:glycosyltransferase involved in cell wall biosynthesis